MSAKSVLLASTILFSGARIVQAAEDRAFPLEEVVVTAQKRSANLQDIALSVKVLDNRQLEELNVGSFNDYIQFLPTLSFQTLRPGISQLYMRGISSGGDGNHSGSMPSVGVYLDEQPLTTINQVLDLHIYDIARLETLSGPQGTLFGASSQSGTLRIITNQPVIGEYQGGYDLAINSVKSGEMGYVIEGFANVPLSEKSAVRLVAWHKKDGGYIDNVFDEIHYATSGIVIDNAELVENNFNDTDTTGLRALLKIDLNESWTATAGLTYQQQKSTGVFTHEPDDVGDLKSREFFPTQYEEDWHQATLTIEGNIGGLDVIYAGAYLNRNVDSSYDYSGYAEYFEAIYAGIYDCVYYKADDSCSDPSQFVRGDEKFIRQSHEFRIQSSQQDSFRWIAGLFYQHQKHDFDEQWIRPDMNPAFSVIEGGQTDWQTKQVRVDRDFAVFGEASYDLTNKLTLLGGARVYKYRNSLYGFYGLIEHCTGFYDDGKFVQAEPDDGGTPQYPCVDTRILDDQKEKTGQTFKVSLSYEIDDNRMVYATFSQGFRPGGVNRARIPGIPSYEEDFVDNYEIGWKTSWLENRLRFNGAVYYVNWSDVQLGVLDISVSPLTIIHNLGSSRTYGAEFDLVFAATEKLTLSLSGSYNEAKLTSDFLKKEDNEETPDPDDMITTVIAPVGTRMPFVPVFQFTAVARFEDDIGGMPAFFQAALSYTGGSWSNLDVSLREKQQGYALLNLSAGVRGGGLDVQHFCR